MKTEILNKYMGQLVNITLNDDSVLMGKLEHMPDNGQRYGFFHPVYYIVGDTKFKSSEVKAFGLLEDCGRGKK